MQVVYEKIAHSLP